MINFNKLFYILPLLSASYCYAEELKNFQEIKNAINNGKKISILVSFDKCEGNTAANTLPSITGVFYPQSLMVFDNKITTSDLHFTKNNPKHKDKFIFEFVAYTIDSENNLKLAIETLNINYTPLIQTKNFTCPIGKSTKIFSN